jgi:hypothetical protein
MILYDPAHVDDLAGRAAVAQEELPDACPVGVLVDRRVEDRASGLPLSPWVVITIRIVVEQLGSFPYVATIGGFVVSGADIIVLTEEAGGLYRVERAEPGDWFDTFRDRRWAIGPGASVLVRGQPRDWFRVMTDLAAVGESGT